MWATFTRFSLEMTKKDAQACMHPGQCYEDVKEYLANNRYINRQLDRVGTELIRVELKEWGAWDAEELADDVRNRIRIVWLAAGNIVETLKGERS